MKLLDCYMSAVAHYLPEARRDEIIRELRSNILDQLEHLAGPDQEPTEVQVAQVLNHMGHPQKVANQFLPPKRLVSEDLFPLYQQVLGYTLLIIFLVELIKISAVFVSGTYVSMTKIMLGYVAEVLAGFVNHGLLAFAIVTGLFYVFSNPPGGKPLLQPYRCWRAECLPPVIFNWQRIRPCNLAGDIGLNVFVLLIIFHQLWMPAEQLQQVVAQFSGQAEFWLYLVGAVVIASLMLDHWNIRYGYWTRSKLVLNLLLNSGSAILFIVLSRLPELFLPGENLDERTLGLVGVIDVSFRVGFLIMGLYLIYEVGRDIYRVKLLNKAGVSR